MTAAVKSGAHGRCRESPLPARSVARDEALATAASGLAVAERSASYSLRCGAQRLRAKADTPVAGSVHPSTGTADASKQAFSHELRCFDAPK